MNYRVMYLLEGKSKKYAENLIKDVAKKFNVNFVYSGKNPAHISLKYRFETNNVKEVEEKLKKLCNKYKSSYFEIGGIGSFDKNTLHLKVKPSKEMISFEKDLLRNLFNFRGDFFKFDKNIYKNFHVGIANHDIRGKFKEIKQYLEKHEKKFRVKFDRFYLIKKPKNKWVVQKEFKLK